MKDSSFESRAKTAQRALFPDWVVILLSIGALMVGLVGTFYLTFDLYGDPGIDECALLYSHLSWGLARLRQLSDAID